MRIWGITDTGLVRRENQDAYTVQEEIAGHTVCVVCDGMGGPAGGRMASGIAVDVYPRELARRLRGGMKPIELQQASAEAVSAANRAIRAAAEQNEEYRYMGTTLVSAISCPEGAVISNVGDSRAYYLSEKGLARVTRDHSLVQNMVERGDITPEEARFHPKRNLITRALGPDEAVECDAYLCYLDPGSCLLLCTDGLTNTVTDEELFREIMGGGDMDSCLERLLSIAKSRGAPDNVTAVLMRW